MISQLLQIIAAYLLGALLSIGAAALVVFGLPKKWIGFSVSFSTGLLLLAGIAVVVLGRTGGH